VLLIRGAFDQVLVLRSGERDRFQPLGRKIYPLFLDGEGGSPNWRMWTLAKTGIIMINVVEKGDAGRYVAACYNSAERVTRSAGAP
jgi:hypothetical protein